jgi:hypothetical protein
MRSAAYNFAMPRLAALLAVSGLLASTSVRAEVYRCLQDGRTTYTDRPCAVGAEPVQLPPVVTVAPSDHVKSLAAQYDREASKDEAAHRRARAQAAERYEKQHALDQAIHKALVEHRVIKGMTPGDVRRVLHAPTRIENEGGVTERWIYEDGAQHRTVTFKDGLVSADSTRKPRRR